MLETNFRLFEAVETVDFRNCLATHTFFIPNNHASFHLWQKKNLVNITKS